MAQTINAYMPLTSVAGKGKASRLFCAFAQSIPSCLLSWTDGENTKCPNIGRHDDFLPSRLRLGTEPISHASIPAEMTPRCRAQQPSNEYVRGEVILAANVIKPDPHNRNRTQFTMLTQVRVSVRPLAKMKRANSHDTLMSLFQLSRSLDCFSSRQTLESALWFDLRCVCMRGFAFAGVAGFLYPPRTAHAALHGSRDASSVCPLPYARTTTESRTFFLFSAGRSRGDSARVDRQPNQVKRKEKLGNSEGSK